MVQRTEGIHYRIPDLQQVNVEHRMLGDEGNVIDGKGIKSSESGSVIETDGNLNV